MRTTILFTRSFPFSSCAPIKQMNNVAKTYPCHDKTSEKLHMKRHRNEQKKEYAHKLLKLLVCLLCDGHKNDSTAMVEIEMIGSQ